MPNPYNVLPSESYMNTLIDAVQWGSPHVAEPHWPSGGSKDTPATPTSLRVIERDYTSVNLGWTVSGNPYAIAIYRFEDEVARIPGHLTRVTIGNLETNFKNHVFKVRAIGKDGSYSTFSDPVTSETMALPGAKPIINLKVTPGPGEIIYEADVLVPYAFVRILVTSPDYDGYFPSYQANTDTKFVCAHYMIEGKTSYQYAATAKDPKTGFWPWLWREERPLNNDGENIKVERDRYHYTWHLPRMNQSFDYTNFIVQGEGFSQRTDVFMPCPACSWKSGDKSVSDGSSLKYCEGKPDYCPYDCKGEPLCKTSPVKFCDIGVNNMQRGSRQYTSNAGYLAGEGNCWADVAGYGCSVKIRGENAHSDGKNCSITGDQMWWAYQDIRDPLKGGCAHCGTKHFSDKHSPNGCMVSIDYYKGCDNPPNNMMGTT